MGVVCRWEGRWMHDELTDEGSSHPAINPFGIRREVRCRANISRLLSWTDNVCLDRPHEVERKKLKNKTRKSGRRK